MILTGYALRIRQLTEEDRAYYDVDLGKFSLSSCVAVFGEDMAECLAAVVYVPRSDGARPRLVWSDADGFGKPIANGQAFADAIKLVLFKTMPHLQDGV